MQHIKHNRVDRTFPVDWDAAATVAARCGARAQGLVAVRNAEGLRSWLRRAARNMRPLSPQKADLYDQLLELLKTGGGTA
jgi:hypothetical protein